MVITHVIPVQAHPNPRSPPAAIGISGAEVELQVLREARRHLAGFVNGDDAGDRPQAGVWDEVDESKTVLIRYSSVTHPSSFWIIEAGRLHLPIDM